MKDVAIQYRTMSVGSRDGIGVDSVHNETMRWRARLTYYGMIPSNIPGTAKDASASCSNSLILDLVR